MEYDEEKRERTSIEEHRINLKGDQEPIAQKRYRETPEKTKVMNHIVHGHHQQHW
jgi:hypothetical protein